MAEHGLAGGGVITNEEAGRECAACEAGAWEGGPGRIHAGRAPVSDEPLAGVAARFPASMVAAVDARSQNRPEFIRNAVAACQ